MNEQWFVARSGQVVRATAWGRRRGAVVACAALISVSVSRRASAEETSATPPPDAAAEDPGVALARAAFEEGLALAHGGRWAEALAAFERSARLRPHAVTSYNIGFCELSLRKYAAAWRALVTALVERDANGAPALSDEFHDSAEAYAAQAAQSLVHLELAVEPRGAFVSVDGSPLEIIGTVNGKPRALAGTLEYGVPEPVPGDEAFVELDPGEHTFAINVKGGPVSAVTRRFEGADGVRLALRAVSPPVVVPPDARRPGPSRTPAYIAFAVGGAGLISGAIFGGLALSKTSRVHSECPANDCPSGEPTSALNAAHAMAAAATISFGVAAAGAVSGAVLWALAPALRTGVGPAAGASRAPSLGWSGTF